MTGPATRYARRGDEHIAYQVWGEGAPVAFIPTWFTHIEARWDFPPIARGLTKLGSVGRFMSFDKRGVGLSDPVPPDALPTLEEWADDLRCVVDDLGWERVSVVANGEGGYVGMLFAAMHPERVSSLVLSNTSACVLQRPDYPFGQPRQLFELAMDSAETGEAAEALASALSPSATRDPILRDWIWRYIRTSTGPRLQRAMLRMLVELDIRAILPNIHVPTLVVHRAGNNFCRVENGRYLAEHIADARYVEQPGDEHLWFLGDFDAWLAEIAAFVVGVRRRPEPERVLATIAVTDIVASTQRSRELGDAAWLDVLARHNEIVRAGVASGGGRELMATGDGFVAAFDGPHRAIQTALSLVDDLRGLGINVRVGVHTGECVLRDGKPEGIGMAIAARVGALAGADEVLVSSTVKELVAGSGLHFVDRGSHELKGLDEPWRLFAVAQTRATGGAAGP
ncbi:MAG: adenylate/guanylate cyclase domain-containing protein [Mycobacteriales bacterium]|nr:adenylate/guanylate cyclase domain-containing protein [Frankia sp.]